MAQCHGALRLVVVAPFLLAACVDGTSPPMQPTPPAAAGLPPFSVSGSVVDTVYRPLGGARVEIVSGPMAGTFAIASENSHFSLPGPFTDTITLLASKDGHLSQTRTIPPWLPPGVPQNEGLQFAANFSLEPIGPAVDIAGVYEVTLSPDRSCNILPEELRTRTYTATIVPSGYPKSFQATLSGAQFFQPWTMATLPSYSFNVGVAGDAVGFYTGFVERIGESNYLVASAGGAGTVGPSGMTASVAGDFHYCPSEPFQIDQGTWVCQPGTGAWCWSENHQLALIKR